MNYEIINTKEGKKAVKPEMERPDIIASSYVWEQYNAHLLTLPTIDLHESLQSSPLGPVEGREQWQVLLPTELGGEWYNATEEHYNLCSNLGRRRIILIPDAEETISIPLKNIEGSMTVSKDASPEVIDAVNKMAELAYNMPINQEECEHEFGFTGIGYDTLGRLLGRKLVCLKCGYDNMQFKQEWTPGQYYQPLFGLMYKEHGLTLLQSELDDIIGCVNKLEGRHQADWKAGSRWDKNHAVRLKAWIDKLLDQSGLAHIGIPKADSPQDNFLTLIEETIETERKKWLSESPSPSTEELNRELREDGDYWGDQWVRMAELCRSQEQEIERLKLRLQEAHELAIKIQNEIK